MLIQNGLLQNHQILLSTVALHISFKNIEYTIKYLNV